MKRSIIKVIIIVCIVAATGFVGILLFTLFGIPYQITSSLKKLSCNGVISSIKNGSPGFVTISVSQQDTTVILDVSRLVPDRSFFSFAAVGDSISKREGTLLLTVKKKEGGETKNFAYPFAIQ